MTIGDKISSTMLLWNSSVFWEINLFSLVESLMKRMNTKVTAQGQKYIT